MTTEQEKKMLRNQNIKLYNRLYKQSHDVREFGRWEWISVLNVLSGTRKGIGGDYMITELKNNNCCHQAINLNQNGSKMF